MAKEKKLKTSNKGVEEYRVQGKGKWGTKRKEGARDGETKNRQRDCEMEVGERTPKSNQSIYNT